MSFKKGFLAAAAMVFTTAVAAQDGPSQPFVSGDLVYGSPDAPVEVIEYGSMTCPHCGHFARDTFPQVKQELIDTGKVRFVFRNFVRDRYDMAVAVISRCTTDRDVTKQLVDTYFTRQDEWMRAQNPYEVIAGIAEEAGITQPEMSRCISDQEAQKHLAEMTQNGIQTYKINSIPYIMVNGKHLEAHSFEAVKEAVEAAK
ncbi:MULTISPECIES: DsbA family protein [Kordiimonas]|jgi:protein-disulfide isomerase|uniref:DsbA family protein n=1 Tax=Kordiimonas TaxID=288021 RepID=UPI00257DE6B8|nr:thioredoxin domain-containing protein [Kordiimonas sp. UBA4487]